MVSDQQKARQIFFSNGFTCVFCKDNRVFFSKKRGVAPLLTLLNKSSGVQGACAADRVVGKAAAFIYVALDVKSVYADVISAPALEVLERYGIDTDFRECVPGIQNRTNTGPCPMEAAVLNIADPARAVITVQKRLSELRREQNR